MGFPGLHKEEQEEQNKVSYEQIYDIYIYIEREGERETMKKGLVLVREMKRGRREGVEDLSA